MLRKALDININLFSEILTEWSWSTLLPLPGMETGMLMPAALMYLLELKRFLKQSLELPVRRTTKIIMEAVVTLTEEEAVGNTFVK